MRNYRRSKTTVSLINYHFVFCPRYRRKIFLNPAIDCRFKELVHETCKQYGFEILTLETNKDYVYLFLNAPPTFSPADIMNIIKAGTSKSIRNEFSELKAMPSLWTRNYLVSTASNVSSQIIKQYVEAQKTRS